MEKAKSPRLREVFLKVSQGVQRNLLRGQYIGVIVDEYREGIILVRQSRQFNIPICLAIAYRFLNLKYFRNVIYF